MEKKFGWRERLVDSLMQEWLPPDKHHRLYTEIITPDHITVIRPLVAIIMLVLTFTDMITQMQFFLSILICVLSDWVDGPLARVLRSDKYRIEPKPFFLSHWVPLCQGVHFDTLSDKFATGVGIYVAIHFGFPWQPLLGMLAFTVIKVICGFHGGWLLGMHYRDLGKALVRSAPEGFAKQLKNYAVKANQSILEGQIETLAQTAVLGVASLWVFSGITTFIYIGYFTAYAAVVSGFVAYRLYIRRYLELNSGIIESQRSLFLSQVQIDLPFKPENRGLIAFPVSKLLLLVGGYWLAGPVSK